MSQDGPAGAAFMCDKAVVFDVTVKERSFTLFYVRGSLHHGFIINNCPMRCNNEQSI
jgi:hypothetical protein